LHRTASAKQLTTGHIGKHIKGSLGQSGIFDGLHEELHLSSLI